MLSEDTIKQEILPYLSESRYGKKMELNKLEIVLAILHRLKTGCQWRMLPVKQYVTRKGTTWNSIYHHFNRWCKDGSWQKVWEHLLKKYKMYLDLSCINLDGSHTKANRGGEAVAYQGRKKCKTTNMLFIIDNQGVILFCSPPIAGNHNDLYNIEDYFDKMLEMAKGANIDLRYLFLNGDAGFDSESFRLKLEGCDIEGNIDFNKRNAKKLDNDTYFDEALYKRRMYCEHSFAWMDAYKGLLVRYEKLATTWFSMNILGMIHIFDRKIQKHIEI